MMNVRLIFDHAAEQRRQKRLEKAQDYIDKECIKRMEPLVPVGLPRFYHSGKLRDSAAVKSPGELTYTAPFAKHDYYAAVDHTHGGNPKAKRMWFEVMKHKELPDLLAGTAKILKCRGER